MKVVAHGNNTSSMNQLVMDNVCRTMIGNSNQKDRKKTRRGGRVNRVRRGSDGFVKSLQMDQQHLNDLSTEEATALKKKKNDIVLCKQQLKSIHHFHSMDDYDSIWNEDSTVQLLKLKKGYLLDLLKFFDVAGRSALKNNGPMRAALSELSITQSSIDLLKSNLLQKLEEYGEEYNQDDAGLDSSFAAGSIADTSINTAIVDTVDTTIVDNSIVDSNISLIIDIDIEVTSGDENNISRFLESEISAGDAGSGSGTDNTAELLSNLPKKKTVSFNPTPSVRTFSGQIVTIASSSSSSSDDVGKYSPRITTRHTARISQQAASSSYSEDEETPRQSTVDIAAAAATSSSFSSEEEELYSRRPRRTTRSQNKRTTRSSNRRPSLKNPQAASSTRQKNNETTTASIRRRRPNATGISEKENPPPPPPPPAQPASKSVLLRRSSRRR
jgi:hypothetical protein